MSDRLLKTREVMEALSIGRTTIYRWMKAEKFPSPIKIGNRGDNRWRQSEIESWILANAPLTIDAELNGLGGDRTGRQKCGQGARVQGKIQ
jgi:prophage regulatory protein